MGRCRDCAWFPWVPGADLSMLPAMRCHPALPARRWTNEAALAVHECPHFKPRAELPNDVGSGGVVRPVAAVNLGDQGPEAVAPPVRRSGRSSRRGGKK